MTNLNKAQSNNFLFTLANNKLKSTEFNVSSFSGLGMAVGTVEQNWQSMRTQRPGDSLEFDEVTLTVMLDEEWDTFEELYNYIFVLKDPVENTGDDYVFEGTLMIANNKNNFIKKFNLKDCWIKSISGVEMNTTDADLTKMTTDITVVFDYYTLSDVT